jgi:hypothetical protein
MESLHRRLRSGARESGSRALPNRDYETIPSGFRVLQVVFGVSNFFYRIGNLATCKQVGR